MLDPEFLELLACPVDKASLLDEGSHLVCTECRRRYPVTDGIPVLLVDQAEVPA
ncbi:MAG TPA: Trm112 family protein [Acidimicrobiia bacterium]|nr:Trm112 family protein [Acidimicrobiia bacterium]